MIRRAEYKDLDRLEEIFEAARNRMHTGGNPIQWTHGYPSREDETRDIDRGSCYVMCDEKESIYAVFTYINGIEPTYSSIFEGAWPDNEPYGTIHRIASDFTRRGVLKEAVEFCLKQNPNLRIDTHKNNAAMRAAIEKCGFVYRGKILIDDIDDPERIAFSYKGK